MNPLETYIRELHDIRSSGSAVKETSYYGPLANLLNEVGKQLKPRVRCIINIQNRGAGIPDGGFFTPDQFQRVSEGKPLPGTLPTRGVMEVKSTNDDAWEVAQSDQVCKQYLPKYRQVLVTNYRDFVLMVQDENGNATEVEAYHLAPNETAFWSATTHPHTIAEEHTQPFIEYLKRVMLHAAPLTTPEDVAWFLASYAHTAKDRIEKADMPALANIRVPLEEALGLTFEGEKGEHFFRSTLIQTIFYGIFSAWVLWSKQHSPTDRYARFDWRGAVWLLHVPVIRAIFEHIATPGKLGPLNIIDVLDWTANVLNRIERAEFFARFEEGHAIQYFYEPFLQAFDPALRKELGIWFTPPEIVQYMVARVDTVLREELDIEDGLADPRVYVLDPCCGTGTYLIEVLKRIATTLHEKGEDTLGSYDVKKAAMERVFGFEILPAPFVVSHLQLGLLLQNLGVPLLDKKNERASVYLTNALTGWEPPDAAKERFIQLRLEGMPELKEERDTAEQIKRKVPILVILGNPPYNAFAGVSPEEEEGMIEPYKKGLITEWGIKKFNLDDLYIRFFRLAEHRIAEQTGKGIVCYISNFSYLSDPSYVVMRQRFLQEFDALWFDCMNGDSRETGKLTPEGKPDPSVFSTEHNREGIQLGTSVSLMVRKAQRSQQPIVRFRQFWGITKRTHLLESLKSENFDAQYESATPERSNRFSFRPSNVPSHYREWPKLTELCSASSNGLMEKRSGALIDIDKTRLEQRMHMYYDRQVSWDALKDLRTDLTEDAAGYDAKKVRLKVQANEQFQSSKVYRYAIRPFETRWCYYSNISPLWNRSRPALWAQCWDGNSFLLSRMKGSKDPEGVPFYFVRGLSDDHLLATDATCFPLRVTIGKKLIGAGDTKQEVIPSEAEMTDTKPIANLSRKARNYLTSLGIANPDVDGETAGLLWMHALAIGYSPMYLSENSDGIRQDWPRVPLPSDKEVLLSSATLGRTVAALLDTEHSVPTVTTGKIRPELQQIAVISHVNGGILNPDAGDLAITAGWGHPGKDSITMPGRGRAIERAYHPDELLALNEGAKVLDLTSEQGMQLLGETTYDIYLNDRAYWRNLPAKVWHYTIGGYQVIKKWLSYREQALLGRSLTREEVRAVTDIARRIAAIVLLTTELDANYQTVKAMSYAWPSSQEKDHVREVREMRLTWETNTMS